MPDRKTVFALGGSLLRGTLISDNRKPEFIASKHWAAIERSHRLKARSCACLNASVSKGQRILERELSRCTTIDYAILQFGNFDCNYNWRKMGLAPDRTHLPYTEIDDFNVGLENMVNMLLAKNIQPVLMNLPPVDSKKFFNTIIKLGADANGVISYLGDIEQIFEWQKMYSDAAGNLAEARGLRLIDVRRNFSDRADCKKFISRDGVHLTRLGYHVMFREIYDFFK